ncbi:MAG: preprotein translocase subunit SecG [Mariniblastus sp.]|nr:preprotein translocase subunit SecG [Mariniblastus sp.]
MALAQLTSNMNLGLIAEIELGLLLLQGLLLLSSIFLMLLVLVQRGKGGGLTGALGGMGGQSAFGSKAGDAFTKITVITAAIWIFLCMLTIATYNPPPQPQTAADKAALSGMGALEQENADNDTESTNDAENSTSGETGTTGDSTPNSSTDQELDPSASVSVDSDGVVTVEPNLSGPEDSEAGDSGASTGSDGNEANENSGDKK